MPERNQDRFTQQIYVSSADWNRAIQQATREENERRQRMDLPIIELIDDLCPEPMTRYRQQYFPPASMSFEIRSDIEEPECEDSDELTEFLSSFAKQGD